jgi:hypothetical protein
MSKQSKCKEEKPISLEERETKAKQLFIQMEEEVKEVRRKYMAMIRGLYQANDSGDAVKENKAWNSPVKKLKDKNKDATRHSKICSDLPKVIF